MIDLDADRLTHLRVMQLETLLMPKIESLLQEGCLVKDLIHNIAECVDTSEELAFFSLRVGQMLNIVNQVE